MDDTKRLIELAQQGDTAAKERLIEENSGLIWSVVRKFRGRGCETDDLFQIGAIGLIKCIDKFDSSFDVKFSTYAVPVILGEIKRLFRDGGTVKVSRSLKELSLKTVRAREEMSKKLGREPTLSELSSQLDADECTIAEALSVSLPPVSLTDNSDESGSQIDIAVPAPDTEIGDMLALRQILELMEEKDRELIYMRYYKGCTQSATAKKLSMTQVQVSRREKKLLQFMREQLLK